MTAMDPPFAVDQPPRPRTSRLAMVAMSLNLPCFLPPFTLLAAVLGAVAYWRVRRRNDIGGAALSMAAVLLGLTLTVISGTVWWKFIRLTTAGPMEAIRAAERGDGDAFRTHFVGEAAMLPNETIAAFGAELTARYGPLLDGRIRRIAGDPPRRGEVWMVPFEMRFERGLRPAHIGFTTLDPTTGRATLALTEILIEDEQSGELRIPARSRTLPPP